MDPQDDDDDRRRGERFAVNAEFAELDPGTLVFVSNVSETGVFINTPTRVPVGTHVELRFTVLLDDPVVIEGPGRVVYHSERPRGMGVEFGNFSAAMTLRLNDVVSQCRTRAMRGEGTSIRTRDLTAEELALLEADAGPGADGDRSYEDF
ncbi:MAG: PilZ domain-containing protein [Myxococcales bacterium]|nr:PilZ domain-containing protein [Myxococcales bacterium]